MCADTVSSGVRSRMMSGIRGKNTKPELIIRSGLHKAGFRFRIHDRSLPGHPDLVLPKYSALIFVHGCFWHGHQCHLFKWPKTREAFWHDKIRGNMERDERYLVRLRDDGWRICIVWECALKGKHRQPVEDVVEDCGKWLLSETVFMEITGYESR